MELYRKWLERLIEKKLREKESYHPAFNNVISIFADMILQYTMILKEPRSVVKDDITSVLRKDIYTFSNSLKLDNDAINVILSDSEQRLKLYDERSKAV